VTFVLVSAVAGSIGALVRYVVTGWMQQWTRSALPVGTAVVNVVGAFLLGVVVGSMGLDSTVAIAAFGFLGGLTTFSTWMVETVNFAVEPGYRTAALANLLLPLIVGVTFAALGFYLSS